MSHKKKKGYNKFSKEPRLVIKSQENGLWFDKLNIKNKIKYSYRYGYCVEIWPGESKDVKYWIKLNGIRIGQTLNTGRPIYSINNNFYDTTRLFQNI